MFTRKCRVVTDYFFLSLSILATILSVAGYFGRLNLYLEFVSGYKLQFFLLGMCNLGYFCLTRKKIGIIISLFCVLLNLTEILPWYRNPPVILT
jgi:hypothetical protein